MHASPANAEPVTAACGVTGHALVESRLADIATLRDRPVPAGTGPLPPRFLRHADEQTVVAMRAVLEAIAVARASGAAGADRDYSDYGVVSAPCQPGRIAAAHSLTMLRSGGPVTVSPHIVPQCSLHSIAGAVSVALGMHGANIGTSGGPHALAEGLLASLTLLATGLGATSGIWFIATAWDVEPSLDAAGRPVEDGHESPTCVAVAVALTEATAAAAARIELRHASGIGTAWQPRLAGGPADGIRRFAHGLSAIAAHGDAARPWSQPLPGAGEFRLSPVPAASRRREAA